VRREQLCIEGEKLKEISFQKLQGIALIFAQQSCIISKNCIKDANLQGGNCQKKKKTLTQGVVAAAFQGNTHGGVLKVTQNVVQAVLGGHTLVSQVEQGLALLVRSTTATRGGVDGHGSRGAGTGIHTWKAKKIKYKNTRIHYNKSTNVQIRRTAFATATRMTTSTFNWHVVTRVAEEKALKICKNLQHTISTLLDGETRKKRRIPKAKACRRGF
jgi:hypothetical protein